jgi:GDPmannose 4,6-dehydratase
MKKAFITGITGQDGSYLAELLLEKGYEVHGLIRKKTYTDKDGLRNIKSIKNNLILYEGDINNQFTIYDIFSKIKFDECYHLAGVSFVDYSLEDAQSIMDSNFNSTHYLLDAIVKTNKNCKFFLAGSSEMFGDPNTTPQTEETPFNPKTIYGISKVSSHYLLKNYREKEHLFACTGIMYNHESPRRGDKFVTKKIINSAIRIKKGLQQELYLGNLDAQRDWGYAPDYVQAMWQIMQQNTSDDFIIATGRVHSVREFVKITFDCLGLNYLDYIKIDPKFFRKSEKIPLCGNNNKLKEKAGWINTKTLKGVINTMINNELSRFI